MYDFLFSHYYSLENKGQKEFYGYSFFKQYKDSKNPRGYSQKSILILSQYPHVIFYKKILSILTEECEKQPEKVDVVFQQAYQQFQAWDKYKRGKFFKNMLFGKQITIKIPGNPKPS